MMLPAILQPSESGFVPSKNDLVARERLLALKTVVGRVLSALLALENALVIVIGLTGVVIWFSGQVAEGGPSEWGVLLVYWVTFSRRVTVTFLILGGLAWLLMRVRSRTLAPPIGEDPMGSQDRLFLVTAILMILQRISIETWELGSGLFFASRLLHSTIPMSIHKGIIETGI